MKRPALKIKQVGVLGMAFRARKVFSGLSENGPQSRGVTITERMGTTISPTSHGNGHNLRLVYRVSAMLLAWPLFKFFA